MHEGKPLGRDRFAEWLGIELLEQSFDQAICRVPIGEDGRNALGGIHGGLIFSLADVAFACACNAGQGTYIGLQAEIRYMSAPKGKVLTATATRVGSSRKFAHYEVVVSDSEQRRIALFTSSAYQLDQ